MGYWSRHQALWKSMTRSQRRSCPRLGLEGRVHRSVPTWDAGRRLGRRQDTETPKPDDCLCHFRLDMRLFCSSATAARIRHMGGMRHLSRRLSQRTHSGKGSPSPGFVLLDSCGNFSWRNRIYCGEWYGDEQCGRPGGLGITLGPQLGDNHCAWERW